MVSSSCFWRVARNLVKLSSCSDWLLPGRGSGNMCSLIMMSAPTCSGTLLREEVLVLRPGPTPGETEGDQCPAIVDLVVATGERQSGLGNMRCGRCSAVRSARRSSRSVPLSASGANSQIGRPKLSKRSKLVCPKANPDKKVPVPAGYE